MSAASSAGLCFASGALNPTKPGRAARWPRTLLLQQPAHQRHFYRRPQAGRWSRPPRPESRGRMERQPPRLPRLSGAAPAILYRRADAASASLAASALRCQRARLLATLSRSTGIDDASGRMERRPPRQRQRAKGRPTQVRSGQVRPESASWIMPRQRLLSESYFTEIATRKAKSLEGVRQSADKEVVRDRLLFPLPEASVVLNLDPLTAQGLPERFPCVISAKMGAVGIR